MNVKIFAIAVSLILVNQFATIGLAQDASEKKEIKPKEMVKDTQDKTLVDHQNSQMDAPEWTKFTTPGDEHKALDAIAGKFTYKSKYWMTAKAKPMESAGTAETKWILNGRYLQQEVEGKMGESTFTGHAITGYDLLRKEYQIVWMDSSSTTIWNSAGKGTKKQFETAGTGSDPMTGDLNRSFRNVTKIINNNEHTFELFMKDKDGKEYRSMEMRYKRVK